MGKKVQKNYSNMTFMSGIVGVIGVFEIVISLLLFIAGFAILNDSENLSYTNQLIDFIGVSVGFIVISTGGLLFLGGALLISISQAVGLSLQNNEMLKDILKNKGI